MEVDLLEPILQANRMCVEYRHVSAYVPAKVTPGGLFTGLGLPAFTAKGKAKEKEKLRRVSSSHPAIADYPLLLNDGIRLSMCSVHMVWESDP